eukprot:1051975-Prorocentrum_minimum.AAC.1
MELGHPPASRGGGAAGAHARRLGAGHLRADNRQRSTPQVIGMKVSSTNKARAVHVRLRHLHLRAMLGDDFH